MKYSKLHMQQAARLACLHCDMTIGCAAAQELEAERDHTANMRGVGLRQ